MRIVGIVVLLLVALLGLSAGICYWWFTSSYPNVGQAPDLRIMVTPEMVIHGEYLANHVCVCLDCHSTRDWRYYTGPIDPATKGKGGEYFDQALDGTPGVLYSANITPAGVGQYSDGELYHTITTGVKRDRSAMFPLMPYRHYGLMDDYDIKSIIAYLRTLAPIENAVAKSHLDFPMNLIVRTIPRRAALQPRPDTADEIAYGGYMTNAAACFDCHSPLGEKGQPISGLEFAGGFEFHFPAGFINRSANITPDSATGIGSWSRDQFIARFRRYAPDSARQVVLDSTAFNTIMPWSMYWGMTDKDLGAIYAWLRTVKPVNHSVTRFERESAAAR